MLADIALPYRTDWRELNSLLDYCKGKGADRSALEARFGAGESLRETLNALEQLRLIERGESGDARLSMLGEQLAYAPDAVRQRQRLTEALLGYPPYRFPLERAVADRLALLEAAWVEHIWQVDMRLGQPRNRVEEARTFFFRLADEAGLGTYRRGVRGQTTRLELARDFAERIEHALAALERARSTPASGATGLAQPAPSRPAAERLPAERPASAGGAAASTAPGTAPSAMSAESARDADTWNARERTPAAPPAPAGAGSSATPETSEADAWFGATLGGGANVAFTVRVNVDMTEWELDKIAAFLRLIGHESGRRAD